MTMISFKAPFLAFLTIGFFSQSTSGQGQKWDNPGGGNLNLWGEPNRLNWGDHNPVDVLEEVKLRCQAQTCYSGLLEIDTQVVDDAGTNVRKKIQVDVTEASFSSKKAADGPQMIEALKGLMSFEPWRVSSLKHWKSGTDGKSCKDPRDNYCWIATGEEGDLVQYEGPKSLDARWDGPGDFSHVNIAITVVDIVETGWDCQKIVDTAEQIAGFITNIPGVAFFLASLLCGGSPI